MESIPEAWPPTAEDAAEAMTIAPLFPLPGVFLFPRQLMPLHIFEPRYRTMIDESLDGPGRIVIGTILESGEANALDSGPAVLPVGGIGEIARHEKLPDGRYLIWLFGLARVRVQELPSDRPYRRAQCELWQEVSATGDDAEVLRPPLSEAIHERSDEPVELPDEVPIGLLSDLLSQRMAGIPQGAMERIFQEPSASQRAKLALAAHAKYPLDDATGE